MSAPDGCLVDGSATAQVGSVSGVGLGTYQTLFLLTSQRRYYFALPDRPASTPAHRTFQRGAESRCLATRGAAASGLTGSGADVPMRGRGPAQRCRVGALRAARANPGDVWTFTEDHRDAVGCQCPGGGGEREQRLSVAVAERAISLSCPPEGLVYDPFAVCAHGPVAQAAHRLGRRFHPGRSVDHDPADQGANAISGQASPQRWSDGLGPEHGEGEGTWRCR
jgi:hypothetical protein